MKAESVFLDGREVGEIVNSILYVSYRRQSKHLYRGGESTIPAAKSMGKAAWGMSCNLLSLLHSRGVKIISVHDKESKNTYYCGIDRFERESEFLNLGSGLQKFLKLACWLKGNLGKLIEASGEVTKP